MAATQKTLGILGGGQLGILLADAAQFLQSQGLIGDYFIQALPLDPAWALHPLRTVATLPPATTHLVFENEFLDCTLLETQWGTERFHPLLARLRPLQDKLEQKRILNECGIPTALHLAVSSPEELATAHAVLGDSLVLKWSRHGYDGKGVLMHSRAEPFPSEFFARAGSIAIYAEERVDFARELAIIACQPSSGNLLAYPLVVSEQSRGICRRVSGPAHSLGVTPGTEQLARDYAQRLARHTGLEGVFAIELFETREGRVLANEIAPRVHNSGHFTLDSCPISQFEAHLRACLDLPLESTDFLAPLPFVMLNLLGPEALPSRSFPKTRDLGLLGFPSPPVGTHLHWYGKSESRPGRKLGHINAVGDTISVLQTALEDYHDVWNTHLRG